MAQNTLSGVGIVIHITVKGKVTTSVNGLTLFLKPIYIYIKYSDFSLKKFEDVQRAVFLRGAQEKQDKTLNIAELRERPFIFPEGSGEGEEWWEEGSVC